jgi:signal transduction histidine kinase
MELNDALEGFARDFEREIGGVAFASTVARGGMGRPAPAQPRFQYFSSTPRLIGRICFAQATGSNRLTLLEIAPGHLSKSPETVGWPREWDSLKAALLSQLSAIDRHVLHPWEFAEGVPAFVRFVPVAWPTSRETATEGGFWIVALDSAYLQMELLPQLARRYFHVDTRGQYHVRVCTASGNHRVIYDSAPQQVFPAAPHGTIGLFSPWSVINTPVPQQPRKASPPPSGTWQLAVADEGWPSVALRDQSQAGNLIMTTASFLLLAVAVLALFLSARRAHSLARAQWHFVSGVSHDLRTPLAALRSISNNLCDGVVVPAKIRRYGQLMGMQVERLSEMVEDALAFARTQHATPAEGNENSEARTVIDEALAAYINTLETREFKVEKEVPEDLPRVECPPSVLRRSLQNLIGTALKYGAEARWIRVAARESENREILISVEDRGCGIRRDEIDRIFEPFVRGRAHPTTISGVGLGLSIVKRSVESIGGRITVESQAGVGSRFTLVLPATKKYETKDIGG